MQNHRQNSNPFIASSGSADVDADENDVSNDERDVGTQNRRELGQHQYPLDRCLMGPSESSTLPSRSSSSHPLDHIHHSTSAEEMYLQRLLLGLLPSAASAGVSPSGIVPSNTSVLDSLVINQLMHQIQNNPNAPGPMVASPTNALLLPSTSASNKAYASIGPPYQHEHSRMLGDDARTSNDLLRRLLLLQQTASTGDMVLSSRDVPQPPSMAALATQHQPQQQQQQQQQLGSIMSTADSSRLHAGIDPLSLIQLYQLHQQAQAQQQLPPNLLYGLNASMIAQNDMHQQGHFMQSVQEQLSAPRAAISAVSALPPLPSRFQHSVSWHNPAEGDAASSMGNLLNMIVASSGLSHSSPTLLPPYTPSPHHGVSFPMNRTDHGSSRHQQQDLLNLLSVSLLQQQSSVHPSQQASLYGAMHRGAAAHPAPDDVPAGTADPSTVATAAVGNSSMPWGSTAFVPPVAATVRPTGGDPNEQQQQQQQQDQILQFLLLSALQQLEGQGTESLVAAATAATASSGPSLVGPSPAATVPTKTGRSSQRINGEGGGTTGGIAVHHSRGSGGPRPGGGVKQRSQLRRRRRRTSKGEPPSSLHGSGEEADADDAKPAGGGGFGCGGASGVPYLSGQSHGKRASTAGEIDADQDKSSGYGADNDGSEASSTDADAAGCHVGGTTGTDGRPRQRRRRNPRKEEAPSTEAAVSPVRPAPINNNNNNASARQSQQQQQQQQQPQPQPPSFPVILFDERDRVRLGPYQSLLRQQMELFEADGEDVARGAFRQSRRTPIRPGQVGLRCVHCARESSSSGAAGTAASRHDQQHQHRRTRGADYYTRTVRNVYQVAQNMAKIHFGGGHCRTIPSETRDELERLRLGGQRAPGGREYWSDRIFALGVYEAEGGALLMVRDGSGSNNRSSSNSCSIPQGAPRGHARAQDGGGPHQQGAPGRAESGADDGRPAKKARTGGVGKSRPGGEERE